MTTHESAVDGSGVSFQYSEQQFYFQQQKKSSMDFSALELLGLEFIPEFIPLWIDPIFPRKGKKKH